MHHLQLWGPPFIYSPFFLLPLKWGVGRRGNPGVLSKQSFQQIPKWALQTLFQPRRSWRVTQLNAQHMKEKHSVGLHMFTFGSFLTCCASVREEKFCVLFWGTAASLSQKPSDRLCLKVSCWLLYGKSCWISHCCKRSRKVCFMAHFYAQKQIKLPHK